MPDIAQSTRKRVLALRPDGNRYDLIDGQLLVSPAARPLHQIACFALVNRLNPYVVQHGLGMLLPLAADLEPEPRQLIQPDLFVLSPGPHFTPMGAGAAPPPDRRGALALHCARRPGTRAPLLAAGRRPGVLGGRPRCTRRGALAPVR